MPTTKICPQCGVEYDVGQKFCPNDGSPLRLQSPEDPLIGQLVADRYQILSLIGEGGMGRVYLAEHVRMGRKSAVKVINPALATTADAIARFNREASNACRINHPNVAQVYDFGEMADGTLYLAMEFVEGETLDAVIARGGPLPPPRAAQIAKQIADALFAAHHLGIVHRDLKPENVMVARHLDGTDWVKVVDFGIAKTVQRDGAGSQTVTTAGVSLGTPEYMSPEQLAGEKLDHRTDIYSLGLVLFNMLTGELPYPKVTSKETLVKRLTSKPRTLAEVRSGVAWPAALQASLDRALAPDVADRYDSVGELGRDVVRATEEASATGSPTPAVTGGPRQSVAPPTRRVSPPEEAVEQPMAHRRALPWAVATAGVLAAIAMFAAQRQRTAGPTAASETVSARDSASSLASAQPLAAPSVGVKVPATPAPPVSVQQRPLPAAPSAGASSRGDAPTARADTGLLLGRSLIFADSATRAAGIVAGKLVNMESVFAKIGPEIARAQRAQADGRFGTPIGRHYWLRRGGDSVAAQPLPRGATTADRMNAAADEIRAHIARMRILFDRGETRAARLELNAATSELAMLRELAPGSPIPGSLEVELGQGVRDLIVACYRTQADSVLPRSVRCDNFLAGTTWRLRNPRQPQR